MQIGLRAFLVIADSREKKEGDPPMSLIQGPLPSKGLLRTKTKFLSTMLTDEIAKKIGIANFYPKWVRGKEAWFETNLYVILPIKIILNQSFLKVSWEGVFLEELKATSKLLNSFFKIKDCIAYLHARTCMCKASS